MLKIDDDRWGQRWLELASSCSCWFSSTRHIMVLIPPIITRRIIITITTICQQMQPVCKRISVLKRPWFRALGIFPPRHILECVHNFCWSSCITISCVLKQSGKLIRFDKSITDSHFVTKPTCSSCYSACNNLENRCIECLDPDVMNFERLWYDIHECGYHRDCKTSSSVTHLLEMSFWEY